MYDDKMTYAENIPKIIKQDNSKLIIIGLIIISLIVAFFLFFKDVFKNKNTKMEDKMVSAAKEYVTNNNITTSKEIYFDVNKLNVSLNDNCSLTSGVIFDGTNYIPNLICSDYKSKVVNFNTESAEYIRLKGDEVMILAKGMDYYDPGYESNDLVVTTGRVGSEEGVYNIFYKTNNSNIVVSRKVIIIDNQEIRNLFPTIYLNGDELIYVVAGNNYEELGVRATDTIDGNISNNVIKEGSVNINTEGEYYISYTITNSRGYSNTVTRKVNVISRDSDLKVDYTLNPNNLTNEEVTIKLTISNEFKKIIFPDGREGVNLTYDVFENGVYKFIIYDMYDRIIEKEIEIDNIDKTVPEGSCIAIRYYNKTEVKVTINTERSISSYEYIINGSTVSTTQSNNYTSALVKPEIVKVKVKDIINNQNELTCVLEDKLTREIVTDSKGKNCLEGMTCYLQGDWGSRNYPYCSMSNNPATCGGIAQSGCSITSATNAIAAMGVKSKNGQLHTPWTVYDELYPVNKKTGQCGGGCSGWSRIRDAVVNAGLTAPENITRLKTDTLQMIIDNLKKGYPVIIHANGHPYSRSKGHYLTLIGINEAGYVFITDSDNRSGINKATYNGKQYYVDTWINPNDLITGNIDEFLLVGPPGMYKGKLR